MPIGVTALIMIHIDSLRQLGFW